MSVQDWWNATTIGDYWRLWNMPVHKWMLRHVYFPALRAGVPRMWAGTLVFMVRPPNPNSLPYTLNDPAC